MEKTRNEEALLLAEEILKNVELSELSFSSIVPKTLRLARLIGDTESMDWLRLEFSGYPSLPEGVPQREWYLGARSGRHYKEKNKAGEIKELMRLESIGRIETEIESARMQLGVSIDPSTSISSANPYQTVFPPIGNTFERNTLRMSMANWRSVLDKIKTSVFEYVLSVYYQLKFGNVAESIFEENRKRVDDKLAKICPTGVKELVAAYENLQSSNESDWSNTANSCRRMLKELANAIFPPREETDSKGIKLTEDAYINRLVAFVEQNSQSAKYRMIVGSQLSYLGDRLDAVNESASKGIHGIIAKQDASRLLIYTYLIVGDILSLI